MGPNQKPDNQSRRIDPATAEHMRAERLSRFAPSAADSTANVAEQAPPIADEPIHWPRAGRYAWAVVKFIAWLKLGGAGAAGLRAVPWEKLASAGQPVIEAAIRERPVTRAFRAARSHPWLAAVSAACVVAAGLLLSQAGTGSDFNSLSDEPITDVREYPNEELATVSTGDSESAVLPVRTAAAFIDSGFVANRNDDAGTVRTVPFETYDSQPHDVEHVGFDSARVSANRGAWLTGTIEAVSDTPRARFTE